MLVLLSFLASLLLSCLCFPSVWASITGGDEFLDAHEAGLAVVASRKSAAVLVACPLPLHGLSALCIGTPFRESGPPACMAKLIMLRHKVSSALPCCGEVAPRARQTLTRAPFASAASAG